MWRFFVELFSYSCFVTVLYVISYSNHNSSKFHQVKHLRELFLDSHNHIYNFSQILSINDYWNWLENIFVSNIFPGDWYNGQSVEYSDGYLEDKVSRLIGWATMRQLRVKIDTCRIKAQIRNLTPHCYDEYSGSIEDTGHYYPGWTTNQSSINYSVPINDAYRYRTSEELDTYIYVGEHATYRSGGYVYKFRESLDVIRLDLSELHQLGWIDRQTRAVLIQMNLYNPSIPIFTSVILLAEFLPSSGIYVSARFEPLDFKAFGTVFQIICVIIYFLFIIYFMIVEILQLKHFKTAYFRQIWSYIELGIIACSWTSVGIHIWRQNESQRIADLFRQTNGKTFISFQLIAYINDTFTFLFGFCCFFGTLKFLRLCRYNRRLALLSNTLRRAARELISFSFMFAIIFMAFLILFYLQFSSAVWEFSSLLHAAQTLFEMLLLKFDTTQIVGAAAVLGPLYFTLFILFVVFITINMFVSIIIDNFRAVRADVHKVDDDNQDLYIRFLRRLQRCCGNDETNKVAPITQVTPAITVAEMPNPIQRLSKKLDQLTSYINRYYSDTRV